MERIFLIIFILLISGFIFWYHRNMEHITSYINKQERKERKKLKEKKNKKNKKNKKTILTKKK